MHKTTVVVDIEIIVLEWMAMCTILHMESIPSTTRDNFISFNILKRFIHQISIITLCSLRIIMLDITFGMSLQLVKDQIHTWRQEISSRPLVLGISGVQGSGKSTLCKQLEQEVDRLLVLSLDDFYLTHNEQVQLYMREKSSLYEYRGISH
jgi:pantothenate kinase-related protein Tda10